MDATRSCPDRALIHRLHAPEAVGDGQVDGVDPDLVLAAADIRPGGIGDQEGIRSKSIGAGPGADDRGLVIQRGVEIFDADLPAVIDALFKSETILRAAAVVAVGRRKTVQRIGRGKSTVDFSPGLARRAVDQPVIDHIAEARANRGQRVDLTRECVGRRCR